MINKNVVIIFPLLELYCFFGLILYFISLVKENIAGLTMKFFTNVCVNGNANT